MTTILSTSAIALSISKIDFSNDDQLTLYLSNGRTVLVPLDKFPPIAKLTSKERQDFEVIDGKYLSFLAIDEVYSLGKLVGLE
ncbi:MAG: DUF2442 domain-containing protein [Tunicatimonas sp.]|uniref:DUF2442 domain-containing protein n=1 Tax=Tunicatimonas sp. TaxID=1940096 RepID=UPI003C764334